MKPFPRSYDVLYHATLAWNIGTALAFFVLTVARVQAATVWMLVLLPNWVLFVAWRVVARRHFAHNERILERKLQELSELRDGQKRED